MEVLAFIVWLFVAFQVISLGLGFILFSIDALQGIRRNRRGK